MKIQERIPPIQSFNIDARNESHEKVSSVPNEMKRNESNDHVNGVHQNTERNESDDHVNSPAGTKKEREAL